MDPWPCSVGQGSSVARSCGAGHRRSSDPAWLWLWPAATALIRALAWEPQYAMGAALKKGKKKNKPPKNKEKLPALGPNSYKIKSRF